MTKRQGLEAKVNAIRAVEGKLAVVRQAGQLAQVALGRYDTASEEGKALIEQEITSLEQLSSKISKQSRPWNNSSKAGAAFVGVLVIGMGGALSWVITQFISGRGSQALATIEGMRPTLVIAAVLSTIVFGGALLLGSLFSSEGTFEDRFRRAREIFLVFSGVFATVLGFYFGAGESRNNLVNIGATLENATVVAFVAGGIPPYEVTVTYGSANPPHTKTQTTTSGFARFTFNKEADNIFPMTVSATDKNGVEGSASVDLSAEDLAGNGWEAVKASINGATQPITDTTTLEPNTTAPITDTGVITPSQ